MNKVFPFRLHLWQQHGGESPRVQRSRGSCWPHLCHVCKVLSEKKNLRKLEPRSWLSNAPFEKLVIKIWWWKSEAFWNFDQVSSLASNKYQQMACWVTPQGSKGPGETTTFRWRETNGQWVGESDLLRVGAGWSAKESHFWMGFWWCQGEGFLDDFFGMAWF